jgi:hypothetical protein
MTFHVADEFGKPLEGATVALSVFVRHEEGEGFGEDVHATTTAATDSHGIATLEGSTPYSVVGFGVRPLPGFYILDAREYSFKSAQNGRWQPWNPSVELILRPILNPVPMYARPKVEIFIPKPNQKIRL